MLLCREVQNRFLAMCARIRRIFPKQRTVHKNFEKLRTKIFHQISFRSTFPVYFSARNRIRRYIHSLSQYLAYKY